MSNRGLVLLDQVLCALDTAISTAIFASLLADGLPCDNDFTPSPTSPDDVGSTAIAWPPLKLLPTPSPSTPPPVVPGQNVSGSFPVDVDDAGTNSINHHGNDEDDCTRV